MKIPKIINNGYVKKGALFAVILTPVFIAQYNYDKDIVATAKTEIKMKDPQRYARLAQKDEDGKLSKFLWSRERDKMNDSLRIDSVAKKAYFEGAQMVRDSINNAKKEN